MFSPFSQTTCSRPAIRAISLLCFRVFTFLLLHNAVVAQNDKDALTLEMGKPIERGLAGGQTHSYRIMLTTGQYVHILVDQRGIDLVLTLFEPNGNKIGQVDSPNGALGPEPLSTIIDTPGIYRLEIHSAEKDATPGRYEVKITELRPANEQDKSRISSERAFGQAEILRMQGTPESSRNAITKYQEYLSFVRATNDRSSEASTLNFIGAAYSNLGENQKALDYYNLALPLLRGVGNKREEATALQNIGAIYSKLAKKHEALDYYEQSLALYRSIAARDGEARSLHNIAAIQSELGKKQSALDNYDLALSLQKTIGDKAGEAATLNNIGAIYVEVGNNAKALDYFNSAIRLREVLEDSKGQAETLNNIGEAYNRLGDKTKAIECYGRAIILWRTIKNREGEAATLGGMGEVYDDLGEKDKALKYYEDSLAIGKLTGNQNSEALMLSNIGKIYDDLGEWRTSLDYYNRALVLFKANGPRGAEAVTLNGIGLIYNNAGDRKKALEYLSSSLTLVKTLGDRYGEAVVLNNIGKTYFDLRDGEKALEYYEASLTLARDLEDPAGEATALHNIGKVFDQSGEYQKALNFYRQALPIWRRIGSRNGEAGTLNNMSVLYKNIGNQSLAVVFGKLSVSRYQELRSKIQALDKNTQQTYLKSIEKGYRRLADNLLRANRLPEAQEILNSFKDQQFFDLEEDRKQLRPPTLTSRENEFATRYHRLATRIEEVSRQLLTLRRNLVSGNSSDEERHLKQVAMDLQAAVDEYSAFLKASESDFAQEPTKNDDISNINDLMEMQAALRQLSADTKEETVAVYLLGGDADLRALLITPNGVAAASFAISETDLGSKAIQLWSLLQTPDYEPRVLARELYDIVFRPIENRLPKDTKTIIWSLDGNLRYLPMAALYDGKQYLVERYNHVVFTRADGARLTRHASSTWIGYGFSSSLARTILVDGKSISFRPLDFAKMEMQIFRTEDNRGGIIDGDVMPDSLFNKATFLSTLKKPRPLIHISSHFRFRPGDASKSFLLLGDGQIMTLQEMREKTGLFQGVELLTLSACDTAAQQPDATGKEVDTFAEVAQRLGASSVLASLWSVSEKSTAGLMTAFYEKRQGGRLSKAEALQQAQLDLLYGRSANSESTNQEPQIAKRGETPRDGVPVEPKYRILFKVDKKRPFAHPYYWASFVLFGNWK